MLSLSPTQTEHPAIHYTLGAASDGPRGDVARPMQDQADHGGPEIMTLRFRSQLLVLVLALSALSCGDEGHDHAEGSLLDHIADGRAESDRHHGAIAEAGDRDAMAAEMDTHGGMMDGVMHGMDEAMHASCSMGMGMEMDDMMGMMDEMTDMMADHEQAMDAAPDMDAAHAESDQHHADMMDLLDRMEASAADACM